MNLNANNEILSWVDVIQRGNNGKYGPRWIQAAAIRLPDGKILYNARHHLIILEHSEYQKKTGKGKVSYTDQGFLLNTGEYLDRTQAAQLAIENGQIKEKKYQVELFSEELWNV